MMLFEELLRVLACPRCKQPLALEEESASCDVGEAAPGSGSLRCAGCALVYPIRDGVAELLSGEARACLKSGH